MDGVLRHVDAAYHRAGCCCLDASGGLVLLLCRHGRGFKSSRSRYKRVMSAIVVQSGAYRRAGRSSDTAVHGGAGV